jgi:hypothetical protein
MEALLIWETIQYLHRPEGFEVHLHIIGFEYEIKKIAWIGKGL